MNTTILVRQYDSLTPWERLSLLAAADARGDEVEGDRLVRTAPRRTFRVADCWGLERGLDLLAKQYLLVQLDLAVVYWRTTSVLDREPLRRQTRQMEKREERLWRALETLAYRIVVNADGWGLFCRKLQIDPDPLLRNLSGYEAVLHIEGLARDVACTPKEAFARLRKAVKRNKELKGLAPEGEDFHLDTADDVARFLRQSLEAQLADGS